MARIERNIDIDAVFARGLIVLLVSLIVFPACAGRSVSIKPPLGTEEGEVYLYVQPFPHEADRLRFTLEGVSAVKENGEEFPLSLALKEFTTTSVNRQRLLGAVRLPHGQYRGFSFAVKDAFLRGEEGEVRLLAPERPVEADFPFPVQGGKASLFYLNFKYAESIAKGFSFTPVFSIMTPQMPAAGVLGFVSNSGSHDLTVFDKNALQAVGVIATGSGPKGMALDQKLRRLYVALSGEDAVEVVDAVTQGVITTIRLHPGDSPQELALTPDGSALVTANAGSNTVSIIDPAAFLETARLTVGASPASVLIDNTGRRAYVFNVLSDAISVVDIPYKSVVASIPTDPRPLRGQFNFKGDRLYVIHEFSPYMTIIDPLSFSLLNRVFAGAGQDAIKVDTATGLIYIGKRDGTAIEIYDPFALLAVDLMKTGESTAYMTIDGDENNLCAVGPENKELLVLNLVTKRMVTKIDVGEEPYWVTLMGER